MKITQETLCKTFAIHPSKKSFFLDIETTGLSKYMNFVFCIGIIYTEKKEFKRIQWMISSEEEELQLLLTFIDFMKDFSAIYTYGGLSFERSFLAERLKYHFSSDTLLRDIEWIDFRRSSFFKKFYINRKITRTQFEEQLGFTRTLSVQGKEIVKLFHAYQISPHKSYEHMLFTHNQEELEGLLAFYRFFEYFKKHFASTNIVSYQTKEDTLIILFRSEDFHTSFNVEIAENFKLSYVKREPTFSLSLPVYRKNLICFLEDYKSYYYVPSQKEVIHQSLAFLIPSSMRRQAKKDECILKKEGLFISLPFKDFVTRIWFDDTKKRYLSLEDFLNEGHMHLYLDFLKEFLFS